MGVSGVAVSATTEPPSTEPAATEASEGTAAPPPSWTGELRPFDVCVGVQADYAPVFVGIELGIWEQYGLDLTADTCPTSPIAIASILNNDKQLANNSVTGLAAAIGQGIPAKVVVPVSVQPTEGNTAVFVPQDSDVQDFADLEGKTLGTITVQGLFHLGLATAMAEQGADPSTLTVVGAAPADLGALLDSGQVDAVMIQDPQATIIRNEYGDSFRDIGNPFGIVPWGEDLVIGALTASNRQLEDDPELYNDFREAWPVAIQAAIDNPDIVAEVVPGYTGMEPELFEQISKPQWTTEIDEANTLEMLNAMLEQEFIGAVPEWDQLYWDGT
jgi:NitT/TauT family transport system substrate-binding protein